MLAFFVSFLSFSGVNSLVPQLPISYTLKFILLNLSAITAMISRLNQGIKASDNGGCQQLITYLELSLVGLVFTTACSILTSPEWVGDLNLNSYVFFYRGCCIDTGWLWICFSIYIAKCNCLV